MIRLSINLNRGWTKWFNKIVWWYFYPEGTTLTSDPLLLLVNNTPGHIQESQKHNVRVKLFPANCTSWKQPCDVGIIAALKKRYKFLYFKEVLNFYQLGNDARADLKVQIEQAWRVRNYVRRTCSTLWCCKLYYIVELSYSRNNKKFFS